MAAFRQGSRFRRRRPVSCGGQTERVRLLLSLRRLPFAPRLSSHHAYSVMSTATPTSTFSTFRSIFDAAFKEYEKKTGQDLQTHPLAAKLDRCDSTDGVLDIFQKQADALDETAKRDQTLMKWLNPTVHVLHMLSATVGGTVSMVCFPC